MADPEQSDVAALTVQLLSAYLANNTVAHTDIADLVRATKAALIDERVSAPEELAVPVHVPAVTARKSLASPDVIISLIDGKPYKTLKRHLATHGLNPAEFRERYGLPASYPMVAPTFAAQRREIAARIGLGRRPAASEAGPGIQSSTEQPSEAQPEASIPATNTQETPASPPAADIKPAKTKRAAAASAPTAATASAAADIKASAPGTARKASAKNQKAVAAKSVDAEPLAAPAPAPEPQTDDVGARPRKARGTLKLFKSAKGASSTVTAKPRNAKAATTSSANVAALVEPEVTDS